VLHGKFPAASAIPSKPRNAAADCGERFGGTGKVGF
jgi:hypothetical protein